MVENESISTKPGNYTLKDLQSRPVIMSGHFYNNVINGHDEQGRPAAVFLARFGIADGAKCDNEVYVDVLVNDSWQSVTKYEAK